MMNNEMQQKDEIIGQLQDQLNNQENGHDEYEENENENVSDELLQINEQLESKDVELKKLEGTPIPIYPRTHREFQEPVRAHERRETGPRRREQQVAKRERAVSPVVPCNTTLICLRKTFISSGLTLASSKMATTRMPKVELIFDMFRVLWRHVPRRRDH
jgi:hypothetical protein